MGYVEQVVDTANKSSLYIWGAVLVLSLLVFTVLLEIRAELLREKEQKARYLVETAHSLIQAAYNDANKRRIKTKQAQKQALASLKALRFGQNFYFWVQDQSPKMLMHPVQPSLEGQDLSQFRDARGKLLFLEMNQLVEQGGEGIIHYYWPKPGSDVPVEKVSFVKVFGPWEWLVGSGIYVEDVNRVFYRYAGFYLLFLVLIILPVAYLFGRSLRKVG